MTQLHLKNKDYYVLLLLLILYFVMLFLLDLTRTSIQLVKLVLVIKYPLFMQTSLLCKQNRYI